MNKIEVPGYDDDELLRILQNKQGLLISRREILRDVCNHVLPLYDNYRVNNGNAFQILPSLKTSNRNLAELLPNYYKSAIKEHTHIEEIRDADDLSCCPMCGSLNTANIDHLLPKGKYPEFSILSLNLVPACKCNFKKGEVIIKANNSARILHPYFDDILSETLALCEIVLISGVPSFSLKSSLLLNHPQYENVKFHIEEIVEKTGIKKHLARDWARLIKKPWTMLRGLKKECVDYPANIRFLRGLVLEQIDFKNDYFSSKNNWDSVFLSGLLDDDVLTWLDDHITTNFIRL